jgi:hypothetical protein
MSRESLADAIRESLDANNAWEQDGEGGILTVFDGNKDVLAASIAGDIAAHSASPTTQSIRLCEALATEHSVLRGPAHDIGGRPFETPGACDKCDLINGRALAARYPLALGG